jgi:hypothetical protein
MQGEHAPVLARLRDSNVLTYSAKLTAWMREVEDIALGPKRLRSKRRPTLALLSGMSLVSLVRLPFAIWAFLSAPYDVSADIWIHRQPPTLLIVD